MSQGKNTEPNKLRNICCQILLGGSSRYIAERLNCSASSVLNYTARLRYAGIDSLDQLNVLSDVHYGTACPAIKTLLTVYYGCMQ